MVAAPALAQNAPPSLLDSFRLGSGGGVLCQVQSQGHDAALTGMFDRSWAIVCRDAARPIGKLYALRNGSGANPAQRLAEARSREARCEAEGRTTVEGLDQVGISRCTLAEANVGYSVYRHDDGRTTWVAEGLSGYDSALLLGLRTIVADRFVDGQVSVATTSISDPAAFARVQAGALDPDKALAEGYRRNNSGDYAEAAEFFGTLRDRDADMSTDRAGEYLINQALQKSNLGEFAEADALFGEAEKIPTVDRVQVRLRRNFAAIHLLNQGRNDAALAVLDRPVVALAESQAVIGGAIEIDRQIAAEINSGLPNAQRLGGTEQGSLSPEERAVILDAQALQLRGTALRLKGQPGEARAALEKALKDAVSIRDGRVISIIRLRAQILSEIAAAQEAEGDFGGAQARLAESVALLETRYPETTVLNSAKARLAGFLARRGRTDQAMGMFREVVENLTRNRASTAGLSNLLAPYFAMLAAEIPSRPALIDDFFLASQTLIRPGVADTQTQLARELSEGTGEAATLFRQATALTRDIERARIDIANLRAAEDDGSIAVQRIAARQADLDSLEREQAITQARLSEFAQFRALSTDGIALSELRAALRADEAYLKLAVVGDAVYALYASPAEATAYRLPVTAKALDGMIDDLRATISTVDNGQYVTYPFDLALARSLYVALTGPVADRVSRARHLVFEPDGALLRLPINLLVADQAGVDRYAERMAAPKADAFDFTGVKWLGRETTVSTAVSARAFRDARAAPRSAATRQYLGFGQNAPVFDQVSVATTRSVSGAGAGCDWPLGEWNKPISASELRRAQILTGGSASDVVTGRAFTDQAIIERTDLTDYRILHFATHGLVTAPRPECPARPALLTSFGGEASDGLLSFAEIYDLKIDADLVILSACDTAGKATVAATREAGVTSGGGTALDGLVRAFIGAGGRAVLASHWPAPDDFSATERLITGLFEAPAGTSVGEALRAAEVRLMDDPATSHPFYWSGFAIIGDGAQPLVAAR
ncbi:MAG: CHAT domain-containing protein [Sphingomonas sp. SCN 67-18]|uniref:CHAT domain-containing protein n=1 Tax=uncultured Sphingomonas sp. TaxID=158754 RepID=UPI00086AB5BD|nr:CHAT domain-containing tetratricopeptide repeat protein [Sphingomonas sp. SCN 67-18]ODU21028.1 MAG: CHAT domain-containing protein [Sphingomonas sp. SCN 67-18]